LAETFLEHNPGSSFSVLLLDAEAAASEEGFDLLSPYDIGLDRREVHRMAIIYDVKEFATAVKPWLLRRLLADGAGGEVANFDPDIKVFAPPCRRRRAGPRAFRSS
jgi:hypothetical protein